MDHDDSVLREAALDVAYEMQMMLHTAARFDGGALDGTFSVADRNAFLESFLIHARIVDEFLRSKPQKDDVAALHYAAELAGQSILSPAERRAIDKQVAHLTASRRDKIGFPVVQIARRLAAEFVEFAGRLDKANAYLLEARLAAASWLSEIQEGSDGGMSIEDLRLDRS